jgi:hypothetical protein
LCGLQAISTCLRCQTGQKGQHPDAAQLAAAEGKQGFPIGPVDARWCRDTALCYLILMWLKCCMHDLTGTAVTKFEPQAVAPPSASNMFMPRMHLGCWARQVAHDINCRQRHDGLLFALRPPLCCRPAEFPYAAVLRHAAAVQLISCCD